MKEATVIKMGFLKRFYLTYDDVESDFMNNCLTIELEYKKECSKIRFKNISMLNIKSLSSMHTMVIASCDIRFRQLEKVNYEIIELENNSISLCCESFEII